MTAHPQWASALLVVGMAVGAALAAAGIVERGGEGALPDDVVALVGDTPITREDLARALRNVESARRGPLDEAARRHVLDQLIDETLLVERGLELGLAGRDPRLRAELSAAVIGLLVARAEAEAADPTDDELVAFYEVNSALFREPDRYEVEHLFVAVDDAPADPQARERAEALAAALARGAPMAQVRDLADPVVAELPGGWVAPGTVREYLGPSVASALIDLDDGAVSEPIRSFGGYHVVRLVARHPGSERPLDEVESEVRAAYLRWAGEQAVARFLERRRREAGVVVREAW